VSIEISSLKQVERSVYLAVTSVPTDSSGIETSFSRLMSEEAERLRVRFISFKRVSNRFYRVRKVLISSSNKTGRGRIRHQLVSGVPRRRDSFPYDRN